MIKLVYGDLVVGRRYKWQDGKERLVYVGKEGVWNQFCLEADPARNIWCEVLDKDLGMMEAIDTVAEENKALKEHLAYIRTLICQGAEVGFNYEHGDWPEKLFHSNQRTSELLDK